MGIKEKSNIKGAFKEYSKYDIIKSFKRGVAEQHTNGWGPYTQIERKIFFTILQNQKHIHISILQEESIEQ